MANGKKDKVNIGLYGCNPYRTGALIDAAFEAFPEQVKITACFDINKQASNDMASRFNAEAYYEEKTFLQADFDLVLISLPPYLHADAFVNCAKAGKNIYIEKPICIDETGKEKILKAKKFFKGKCYVGLSDRYIFPFRKVMEIAKNGGLGIFNLSQRSRKSLQYGVVNMEKIGIYYEWGEKTQIKVFQNNSRIPETIYESEQGQKDRDFLQMQDFLQAYLNDKSMPIGIDDGIKVFDMALAIRKSYKSGKKINIEDTK